LKLVFRNPGDYAFRHRLCTNSAHTMPWPWLCRKSDAIRA